MKIKQLLFIPLLFMTTSCVGEITSISPTELPSSNTSSSESSTTEDINMKYEMKNYTNPIAPDCADPSVVRDSDGMYYIYGTGGVAYKSHNMIDFIELPRIARTVAWGATTNNIWAPDVVKIGNTYNYYYSNSGWGTVDNAGIGVMTSSNPYGPFTDLGKIFTGDEIGVKNSIDSCVYYGEDGKLYMMWGSFMGNYVVELNEDGLSLKDGENAKNTKILVAGIVGNWNGSTYEGSYVIKKDGYYYLFVSSGKCCEGINSTYHVRVARSLSPTGPFVNIANKDMLGEERGELIIKGTTSGIVGPGHNSIFIDDAGEYWLLAHGYDSKDISKNRQLVMERLHFRLNGFPYIKNKGQFMTYDVPILGPKILKKGE